ncbi:hypothetical protein FRC18_007409 [Serendipita sp. 400]|nr:hypothetical protein FRC18_007409 [Serendipita sp. 400]
MWDYYAHTMKGLARALGYTQGSNFELYVTLNKPLFLEEEEEEEGETEEGALVPWGQFKTHCTSFVVFSDHRLVYPSLLEFMGHLPTLDNLTNLSITGNSTTISSIIQHIPPDRSRLQSLVLSSDLDLGQLGNTSIYKHNQQILKRLRRFSASWDLSVPFLKALLASFEDLEELTFSSEPTFPEQDLDLIRQTVDWKFQPRVVEIDIMMLPMFPPSLLGGLTKLSLYNWVHEETIGADDPKLELPRLTSLSLHRSRSGLFRFEAPNLRDLHLSFTRWNEHFDRCQSLRPTLVEIQDLGESVSAFLLNPPFPDINELHIYAGFLGKFKLPELLSLSLSGPSPLLPKLRHLLVTKHFSRPNELERFERELLGATSGRDQLISVRCTSPRLQ